MSTALAKLDSREVLGKTVSIYGTYEYPLFPAKDVAEWIEHKDISSMLRAIDDNEKIKRILPPLNKRKQKQCLINLNAK
ncbi:hypothetical protein FACS1894214_0200 [Planctomycetales bacterium]|nr:hypothetical protein FACS1894214_0200 [Planctomycetales bacterium]